MAMAFETRHTCLSCSATITNFFSSPNIKRLKHVSLPSRLFICQSKRLILTSRLVVKTRTVNVAEKNVAGKSGGGGGGKWGKVSAVLIDMDGVLYNSKEPSRRATINVFIEMGVQVTVNKFVIVPFMGMGTSLYF